MKLLEKRDAWAEPFFPWGFRLLDRWLEIRNKGKSLGKYFEDNSICCIAIYGLGAIGKRLYEECRREQVEVRYGIDRNAADIQVDGLEIRTLDQALPEVDAVIVTPVAFYEIQKELYRKMGRDIDIIFIEDVVDYCFSLL